MVILVELDLSYIEGIVCLIVIMEVVQWEIFLLKGSFWVSMRQRNVVLVMVVFELENIDLYVLDNVVLFEKGWEYFIFWVMLQIDCRNYVEGEKERSN